MTLVPVVGDNERVIELTEPQVWVLIGVFSTAIIGMLGWQTVMFNRALTTSIDSVRLELQYFREGVDAKFDVVNHKIDSLDRDVQALTRHVFGSDTR